MPCLRHRSATFAPASPSLMIDMIFSSLNFDFFTRALLCGKLYSPLVLSVRGLHADSIGIDNAGEVTTFGRWQRTAQIRGGIAFRSRGRNRIPKDLPAIPM